MDLMALLNWFLNIIEKWHNFSIAINLYIKILFRDKYCGAQKLLIVTMNELIKPGFLLI